MTLLLDAAPTRAQTVRLDVQIDPAAAPFSEDELRDAVGLRGALVPDPGAGVTNVVVTAPAAGQVLIRVGVRLRQLEIGERTPSADAARLAALLIWDLVRPVPALMPATGAAEGARHDGAPAGDPSPPAAMASADLPVAVEETAAPAAARDAAPVVQGTFRVSMTASVAFRTTDAGPVFAPLCDAQWAPAAARAFTLSAAAGVDRTEVTVRAMEGDRALGLTTVPVRVGVGVGGRAFGVRAGVLARAYFADGLTRASGILWGGFAAATVAVPVRGSLVPFATAGLDVHAQPVAFSFADQPLLALHTLAPWLGVGLSWTWGQA